ncbi:MAG: hypothetical protein IPM69_07985 [Ignavibacteria bacterium]|nr:hypothetical protein [Ignavibacteria bacterium]
MKHLFTLVLACLLIASAASAQNLEYFTALKGISTARAMITSLGIADAKLIAINSHIDDDIINFQGIKNKLDSTGHALNWNYLFSYNTDSRLKLISLSKPNGNFSIGERYDIATIDYDTLYEDFSYTLDNFIDMPTGLVDSDFLSDIEQPNIRHSEIYYSLTSVSNLRRVDSTFIWEKCVGYIHYESNGLVDTYGTLWIIYFAETGILKGSGGTLEVQDKDINSTFTLSPNPTTGNISIKGTTASPISPVNVRIINALGKILHQENITASADGTFTYVWDSNTDGNLIPTGAYSAVMTVGSVVKNVPFVVVR